eukprot:TRINITY_DN81029_c0_g1_i1.p1 TRINITY_DN81029_c0_g1~~TRINITY_DN81029_c0_g1_i1.p1  ORF type:complete len:269 (-),score=46.99 TRINITY_DN81029_c0_g1_i1:210-1016(-)
MNWKKIVKAVLFGVTLVSFCTGILFQEWLRMYEFGGNTGFIKRASGSSHDYYRSVGLMVMQRNFCKDGKSDPHEGDGVGYGGKTCSFTVSTHDTFHSGYEEIRYKESSGMDYAIQTDSETHCYKSKVEDTQNFADRLDRLAKGLFACAILIILIVIMISLVLVGKVFGWKYISGVFGVIVLSISSLLGLFVLILSASLPPRDKYSYCVENELGMIEIDFEDIFSLGWCWYIFLVGFLTLSGAIVMETLVAIEKRRMQGTSEETSPLAE